MEGMNERLPVQAPEDPQALVPDWRQVSAWLEEWWSPEEIALRLRADYPDDPMMWVSHETIYRTSSSRPG